jgi:5-methylcytosine-specific restriction endonuclease McrA
MKVLALSHTYEPLGVINWEKAITLLCAGKVKTLSEYDQEVRSPSISFRVPSVVVFNHNKRNRVKSARFSRKNVWVRDNGQCQYCSKCVNSQEFTLDHVIPRKNGGTTVWNNVVTCCYQCNQKKGDKTPQQAGMRLLKPVTKPETLPYAQDIEFYNTGTKIPESWKFWLGET